MGITEYCSGVSSVGRMFCLFFFWLSYHCQTRFSLWIRHNTVCTEHTGAFVPFSGRKKMTLHYARDQGDDKGPQILGVCWGLTTFTACIVLTRLYIRKWVLYNPGPDDWLIAVSMVYTQYIATWLIQLY